MSRYVELAIKAAAISASFFWIGCTNVCLVSVRASAATVCEQGEAWETCIEKVESQLQEIQDQTIEMIKKAAK